MGSTHDVRASLVNFGVNHEGSDVEHLEWAGSILYLGVMVNQKEILRLDEREVLSLEPICCQDRLRAYSRLNCGLPSGLPRSNQVEWGRAQ